MDSFYTEENKVTCLVRAGKRSIIAADELGTIRIFGYPNADVCYRLYSHHLCFIKTLKISQNKKYLLSSSTTDKCIFIWNIRQPTEQDEYNLMIDENEPDSP